MPSLSLEQWMERANKIREQMSHGANVMINAEDKHVETLRFNHMCQESYKLACLAAKHHETYIMVLDMLKDLSKKVDAIIDSLMSSRAAVETVSGAGIGVSASNYSDVRDSCIANVPSSHVSILDPHVSRTKGRKKDEELVSGVGRMKSGLKMATKKNKRMCRTCNKLSGHDSRTCPLNPKRRNKNAVESSSDVDPDVLMGGSEDDDYFED
ncbi:hypothetical protein Dimus_019434 [Dionaea muscipula]